MAAVKRYALCLLQRSLLAATERHNTACRLSIPLQNLNHVHEVALFTSDI
jgi:hypothetical protein